MQYLRTHTYLEHNQVYYIIQWLPPFEEHATTYFFWFHKYQHIAAWNGSASLPRSAKVATTNLSSTYGGALVHVWMAVTSWSRLMQWLNWVDVPISDEPLLLYLYDELPTTPNGEQHQTLQCYVDCIHEMFHIH